MTRLLLAVAALGLVLLLLVRTFGVRYMLFPTWMLPPQAARPVLDGGEVWTLRTTQGDVEAFFFPAGPSSPTVIFTHGNLELIDYYSDLGKWYQQQGFSVLIPEYRGYGRSSGAPSKTALVSDVVAFYDRLRDHPSVDSSRIYFHGRSLGGAIAAEVSTVRPPRGLVLESTFTSVKQLARERRIPGILVGNSFDAAAALTGAAFPVLLIHGRADDIVPVHHATQLAEKIPRSSVVLLDCGHNDCPRADSDIMQFLRSSGATAIP